MVDPTLNPLFGLKRNLKKDSKTSKSNLNSVGNKQSQPQSQLGESEISGLKGQQPRYVNSKPITNS